MAGGCPHSLNQLIMLCQKRIQDKLTLYCKRQRLGVPHQRWRLPNTSTTLPMTAAHCRQER